MSDVVKDGQCFLFLKSLEVRSAHCHLCLVGKAGEGFPERCPHGVKLEDLPLPAKHGTFRVKGCAKCPAVPLAQ